VLRVSLTVVDKPETRVWREGMDARVLGHEAVSSAAVAGHGVGSRAVAAVVEGNLQCLVRVSGLRWGWR
jgi:hypothetical protein